MISQERSGAASFYHTDGQLSTRQLTNASGQVTDRYTYDAFGVTLASTGTTANNYLYTGEQFDPNVGFYHLRARYLNHAIGRFASQDPFPGTEQDPLSLHKYLYGNVDPTNRIDPAGLESLVTQFVGAVVRGVLFTLSVLRGAIPAATLLANRIAYWYFTKAISIHLATALTGL